MSSIQSLLLFIIIVPLVGILAVNSVKQYPAILKKIIIIIPIILILNSFGLLGEYFSESYNYLVLFNVTRDVNIGFHVMPISLIFLVLLSFIWLGIACYSNKYFALYKDNRLVQFQIFSILSIEFIILILFSKNLVSMFLFYQALIFCLYFFSTYFINREDADSSYNFIFLILLSSFIFFLAIIFTYKITGQVEFVGSGVINNNLSLMNYSIMLFLYFFGIVAIIFIPLYLVYGKLHYLTPPVIISIFIISYGLVSQFIIFRIITYIFGINLFISYNNQVIYDDILVGILALNLLISAFLTIKSKNLKSSLIYLFFNQLIFSILSFFIFKQNIYQSAIVIISFISSQILIFLCIGNINIYLSKSKARNLNSISKNLKITVMMLIFALLSILGVAPSIGLIEKYLLFTQIMKDKSLYMAIIVGMNLFLMLICVIKISYPMLKKASIEDKKLIDLEIVKKIESDFGLMLPIILIASIIFISFFFQSIITSFAKMIF